MSTTASFRPHKVVVESRESFARRTIAHAFDKNPHHVWTRENLATWYAIPLALVEKILTDLIDEGVVRKIAGDEEVYLPIPPLQAVV